MGDMIKVDNKSNMTLMVGSVRVSPKAEGVEVDSSALAAMADKKAGPAANAMYDFLKKVAGRPKADKKETKKEKAIREEAEFQAELDAEENEG